eukprot:TRINITY_DN10504_c0_g2_i1.p1 TRINITY_DN10504_c0_g2~~TRINITY_DN10504_c0_g2_i1.p1  ORF type:complete len:597 (+),score=218.58 TRINITY_DN10504_c0_g2_i1:77-1867(+)
MTIEALPAPSDGISESNLTHILAAAREVKGTPQMAPGEPPDLVPLDETNSTPPRLEDHRKFMYKAATPNPAKLSAEIQYFGAHTPPPVSKYVELLESSNLLPSLQAEDTPPRPEPEPVAPLLQQQAMQQPMQHQSQGPGTLYPVWDEGKLVGYMAVPAGSHPQQQPHTQPRNNYGYMNNHLDSVHALSEIHINQQQRVRNQKDLQQQSIMQQDWSTEAGIDIYSIVGRVVEVARDHAGSRALQRRLDMGCTDDEKEALFKEVEPKCSELMVHMFGNYVVQKLFEHGLPHQVQILSEKLRGNILSLTLSPYGCRVVQKALEVVELKYRNMAIEELTGHVPRCVQDQNGNHVIQKCIETMPNKVDFIVCAFRNNVQALAMHAYGCRVIQRLLEYCKRSPEIEPIIQEVLAAVDQLVGDRYGNYVVQHVIINGEPQHRTFIAQRLKGSVLALARGKFSSNVVEKMFEFGSHSERDELLNELVQHSSADGMSGLIAMVQDPFANYVVQKMLDCCDDLHQKLITEHIRPHVASLRRFNYGKHIITRLEKAGMSLGGTSPPNPGLIPMPTSQSTHGLPLSSFTMGMGGGMYSGMCKELQPAW